MTLCTLRYSSHPPLHAHFHQALHTVHLKYFIYLHSTLNQPRQPQAESHASLLAPHSRSPLCLLKYAFIRHAKEAKKATELSLWPNHRARII